MPNSSPARTFYVAHPVRSIQRFTVLKAPCREAGDQGILLDGLANVTVFRQRGRWTQWVDFQPEPVQIQKVKGNWQVQQDTWLLRGSIPGAEDFANAGVK